MAPCLVRAGCRALAFEGRSGCQGTVYGLQAVVAQPSGLLRTTPVTRISDNTRMTRQEGTDSDTTTKVCYSPAYAAAACDFDTTRKSGWIAESLSRRPIGGVELVAPSPLTAPQLERVHAPEYVDAIRTGEPRALAESNGLGWDSGLWTATSASNGGVVAAVLEALRTGRNTGSLSSGLHHARAASGSGFCTFNGLALGARAAHDAGAHRVLIIDLDAHCGGGTVSIIEGWEVVHIDVAVSRFDRYDVPGDRFLLQHVRSPDDYLPLIEGQLRRWSDLHFDIVIYNAGMDPHQASLGGLHGITFTMLAQRERLVFEWARAQRVPVAFVLAGGYLSERLSHDDLVGLHRLTLASATLANTGEEIDVHRVMDAAYAGPHRGTEGFAFEPNGRKTDEGFHQELLSDEEHDPFAYDIDKYLPFSPENESAW